MIKSSRIAGAAFAVLIVLLAAALGYRAFQRHALAPERSSAAIEREAPAAGDADPGFLYGRVRTVDGATFEGRLRWGRNEEALWGNYFNGVRKENPWVSYVPPERLPKESRPFEIFGVRIAEREYPIDTGRLFMSRFGDLARIEAHGRDVRVILKSGAVFELDRFSASDFDDGLRVWDGTGRATDLDSLRIRAIELLPNPRPGAAADRLHGTVRTKQGTFTGFIQWDREQCIGADELTGHTSDGEIRQRFDSIRAIARRARDSYVVTQRDGSEIVLSSFRQGGAGSRGIYVDDSRYGRVLVSWEAFEGLEFQPGGSGPAYGDFPPGGPLTGAVTARDGRRFSGRLVYDLDESELTETLDAPLQGVDYTIPFGLIASVTVPGPGTSQARVRLHSGEELQLELTGDLGPRNGGMLIFTAGSQRPEYVTWAEVEQIAFNQPPAMYPPPGRK